MRVNAKGSLTQEDYYYYDSLCGIMDKGKRIGALDLCSKLSLKPIFFMVGCDEVVFLEGDGFAIVAVSGSDKDKAEWRGNFNPYRGIVDRIRKAPKTKKGFHYNYWVQARLLKFKVKQLLKECKTPIYDLVLDGHSRGASIATLAYMQMNCEHNLFNLMCVAFDPARSYTRRGWKWYDKNRKLKTKLHRVKTFLSIVGAVPPAILGWIHRETTLLKLPNVKGKFNHTAITEGLDRKFKKGKR